MVGPSGKLLEDAYYCSTFFEHRNFDLVQSGDFDNVIKDGFLKDFSGAAERHAFGGEVPEIPLAHLYRI